MAVRALLTLAWLSALDGFAQTRTVAITIDDLPYAGSTATLAEAEAANRRLLAAFTAQHVPVTGFVIQKGVEALGAGIVQEWIRRGFDLGNHTYSHADPNELSIEQVQEEIVRGESTVSELLKQVGKRLEFLRFPMNHTGDSKAKHDAIAAFLARRGYRLATCTIENSDYLFNAPYLQMLARNDDVMAAKLRLEYLAYTAAEIDYYAGLNRRVFGYEPPEVMLLHDNRLNADVIDQVLALFAGRHYRFVSLDAAQSDQAYRMPDTFVTKYGPMWGYRWAQERKISVNGRLEPEPPKWVSEYGH